MIDFSLFGLRPAGMPNLGASLWPKKSCSWRYDAF